MGVKKEIYRDVQFFHGALQLIYKLRILSFYIFRLFILLFFIIVWFSKYFSYFTIL